MIRAIIVIASLVMSACVSTPGDLPTDPPTMQSGLERGGWLNRYFKYNGKYNYYVGFDLQQLHADTNTDYEATLDFLASYGVNKVRIWLYPSWFGLPGEKNYPTTGKILYPWKVNQTLNKFDIDNWDSDFWERTKDFLAYAKSKKFIVEVSLFTVQEPKNFFRDSDISYPFHFQNNVQNFGRPTDNDGRFMYGFFDLNYSDNNLMLADYHKAYIDKALNEFGSFDHIYYELINESPGDPFWVNQDLPHNWMKYWMSYMAGKTSRIITTHNNGFMNLRNDNEKDWTSEDYDKVGQRYWNENYLDGFNFHLYSTNPNNISMALTGYQLKGQMLICNEGDTYYDIDKSNGYPNFVLTLKQEDLYGEIRHAWGMMTAGGYYSIFYAPTPQVGDESAKQGANAMQAMRKIVEMTKFQQMRPVRTNGVEYDNLVTQGPAPDWQVIAEEGLSYIVYFWGNQSTTNVTINLPAGSFGFSWMDTRTKKASLKTGTVTLRQAGRATISAPRTSAWSPDAGIVLVIQKQ